MKSAFRIALCLSLTAAQFATPVVADEGANKPWSIDLSTGFYTDYMFRGFTLYDGTAIQPSAAVNYDLGDLGSVSATTWASIAADNRDNDGNFTEVDYVLGYSKDIGALSLGVGHIWYTFPDDPHDLFPSTEEVYFSVGYDTLLAPTLTMYHDYQEFDNQYYELNLSHEVATDSLGKGFAVTPFAIFGFASNAEKVYADDGLVLVTTGITTDLPLGDFVVAPTFNYTFEADDNLSNNFWSGVNLSYGF